MYTKNSKRISACCSSVLLLVLLVLGTHAQAKEEIIWWDYHWPPLRIMEGELKGEGRADKILNLVHQNLPEFKHKGLKMNFTRFESNAKGGKIVCSDSMIKKPEREEYLVFSVPMGFAGPKRIVIKTENLHKFGNKDSVSLETLLQDKSLKVAIKQNLASYGSAIESILEKHHQQPHVTSRVFESNIFFKMMLGGRIDYMIAENSYLAQHELNQMKKPPSVTTLNILEDNQTVPYHFACTKSALGKRVIERVDEVLLKARATSQYRDWTLKWYLPSELAELNQYYDSVLLN